MSIPYEYYRTSEGVRFYTENGVEYNIVFREALDYFSERFWIYIKDNLSEMLFDAEGERPSIYDPRVRATIMHVLRLILSDRDRAIFFMCDWSDGMEAARFRLFERWVRNDPNGNLTMLKLKITSPAAEDVPQTTYYIALVCDSRSILFDKYQEMLEEVDAMFSK